MNFSQIPGVVRKALAREISTRYRKRWAQFEEHLTACQELATLTQHQPLTQAIHEARAAVQKVQDEVLVVLLALNNKETP